MFVITAWWQAMALMDLQVNFSPPYSTQESRPKENVRDLLFYTFVVALVFFSLPSCPTNE